MTPFYIWVVQLILISLLSPFFIGFIRKIKAKLQNRQGAGIFQPYKNLWKLFHKDEVISADASWIFRFTPYVLFGITVTVGSLIPLVMTFAFFQGLSDFLVIIYLLAIGTFFLALAGMDTGSAFGGTGSSREMTISALAEGGLILSILTLVIFAGSTNLFSITQYVLQADYPSILKISIAFIAFIIALLAETGRYPFDNPGTHLELTMIHEAMILEYSGKRLALIEWASANKFLIFAILGINLFFPWGIASSPALSGIIFAFCFLILKILVLCVFIAVLESITAKFRFFKLPEVLFTSVVLGMIAIILII